MIVIISFQSGFYLPDRRCALSFTCLTFHSHSPKRLVRFIFHFTMRKQGSIRLTGLPRGQAKWQSRDLNCRCDSNIHFCKQELLNPVTQDCSTELTGGTFCIILFLT